MKGFETVVERIEKTDDPQERHRRKCSVCRHPDREEIEQEFIRWQEPWAIARDYRIDDYRSIYRHAQVFGLIERRRANMRPALDRIIEQTPDHVSADAIIRAIRAQACLTDDSRWIEPSAQVVFTTSRSNPVPDHSRAGQLATDIPPNRAGIPAKEIPEEISNIRLRD